MGNQKQKWTQEEEEALLAGVAKHGPGKWKNILKDPDFAPFLTHRSNIDLKDKWRNLSVSTTGQGSREKSRTFKVKTTAASPLPSTPNSAPATSHTHDASSDTVMDDPSSCAVDGNNAPRYNAMVFEALESIKDTNGSDISAIVNFVEQRHEVPQNFRRVLSSRLRRLVSQGKLEKVQNCYKIRKDTLLGMKTPTPKQKDCYKIRKDTLLGTKTPTPKQKDVRPWLSQNSGLTFRETVEEVAITAAYKVAEAENKSFLAAEAVKEAERVAKMAEDAESMLQLVKQMYEQCSHGEIVLLA